VTHQNKTHHETTRRQRPKVKRRRSLIRRRPTEVASGIGGAGAVFAWLTQAGLPELVAAVLAVVAGFLPAAITQVNELLHPSDA
jgi:hypothetical protein